MERRDAEILRDMNVRFYHDNARSFSQTRQAPWQGWERVLDDVGCPTRALDLASGNLRFQKFVNARYSDAHVEHYCVDACDSLLDPDIEVSYQHLDIVSVALSGTSFAEAISCPPCDLATTFGFMHHVPGIPARLAVARALIDKTRKGGHAAISFWRFAEHDREKEKAKRSTEEALRAIDIELDANDYLLGWNNRPGSYRYCHSFSDDEIDAIIDALGPSSTVVDRFASDGKTGDMNAYVVLAA